VNDRWLALEGPQNFRDLGGYVATDGLRVKRRVLYRSDALHRLTRADIERLRGVGLVTVVDLRAPDELDHVGRGLVDELGARYLNLPTRPRVLTAPPRPPGSVAEYYVQYLDEGASCFAGILGALAEPGAAPAVFFCNAGKDRTGMVAAFLLGLLGVPDEDVVADYALTELALEAIRNVTLREYPRDVVEERNVSPDLLRARPETMVEVLALVRERHGGWPAYVQGLGVDAATVERVRDAFLEPVGAARAGGEAVSW
jgi:protein-tyrosine phosphatase